MKNKENEEKLDTPQKADVQEEKIDNNANKQENKPNNDEEKNKAKKSSKKVLMITIIIAFSLLNMNNEKIIKGVSILGIDVSNLTVEEAKNQINDAIESRFQDENNNLILKRNDEETNVTANTFNAKFDVDKAVIEAYNIGRNGNIITENYFNFFMSDLFDLDYKS